MLLQADNILATLKTLVIFDFVSFPFYKPGNEASY